MMDAMSVARQADTKGQRALDKMESHEQLCTERYSNINNQLKAVPEIYKSINALNARVNIFIGIGVGLSGLSLIVGVVYGIMRISGSAS